MVFDLFLYSVTVQAKNYIQMRMSTEVSKILLKLINYSCSSYPTRASYSGQVDEFRNPMKTELKTRLSSTAEFSTRFSLDI